MIGSLWSWELWSWELCSWELIQVTFNVHR